MDNNQKDNEMCAAGVEPCACAVAALRDSEKNRIDAERYRFLRERDLGTIENGGLFVGMTPENFILNGCDLDDAIDKAMNKQLALEQVDVI